MKEQNYIVCLEENGKCVEFERWHYKRLSTCINKTIELYKSLIKFNFVQDRLKNVNKVVFYQTPDHYCEKIKVHEIEYKDFLNMLN